MQGIQSKLAGAKSKIQKETACEMQGHAFLPCGSSDSWAAGPCDFCAAKNVHLYACCRGFLTSSNALGFMRMVESYQQLILFSGMFWEPSASTCIGLYATMPLTKLPGYWDLAACQQERPGCQV